MAACATIRTAVRRGRTHPLGGRPRRRPCWAPPYSIARFPTNHVEIPLRLASCRTLIRPSVLIPGTRQTLGIVNRPGIRMSPILVTGIALPYTASTLAPPARHGGRRGGWGVGSRTTWTPAPESNWSFGHGGGRGEELPPSPGAGGCADADAV